MILRFAGRESAIALVLCLLLLWAPLPAGSVTPAGQLVFRLAVCALFAAVVASGARPRRRILLPAAALAAIGTLGLVQSCPWPAAAAAVVSPEHLALAAQAARVRGAPGPPAAVALAVDAAAARSAAVSWLVAGMLLVVILVAARRAAHRRYLLLALVAAAIAQLGIGLARLEASSPGGLASVLLRPEGRLRGTFANPNHLSLLFEIGLAALAGWVWLELFHRRRGARRRRALVPLLAWGVLAVGVMLTGSRAGLAAAGFGLFVQLAAALFASRRRAIAVTVTVVLVAGAAAAFLLRGELGVERYETVSLYESNVRSRLLVVEPSIALWRRFPLTGTGLGTFEEAFPLVAPPELGAMRWNRAHNGPLELLVTGGAAAVALGLVGLAALARPAWRRLASAARPEERAAGIAALGAAASAGLHELFDFGLVIPANALALLVVLGSAAGAAAAAGRPRRRATPDQE